MNINFMSRKRCPKKLNGIPLYKDIWQFAPRFTQIIPQRSASRYYNLLLSRGPRNLVYHIVINIKFLLAIFDEGAWNMETFSFGRQTRVTVTNFL